MVRATSLNLQRVWRRALPVRTWRCRNPGEDAIGVIEYIEGHWLMTLSGLIVFLALAGAVGSVRGRPRSVVFSTWLAFIGSMLMAVGLAWDSVRHIQGIASPSPYAMFVMLYGGLVLAVVGITAALALGRRATASAIR
jgi:hypothetical protein